MFRDVREGFHAKNHTHIHTYSHWMDDEGSAVSKLIMWQILLWAGDRGQSRWIQGTIEDSLSLIPPASSPVFLLPLVAATAAAGLRNATALRAGLGRYWGAWHFSVSARKCMYTRIKKYKKSHWCRPELVASSHMSQHPSNFFYIITRSDTPCKSDKSQWLKAKLLQSVSRLESVKPVSFTQLKSLLETVFSQNF